MNSRLSNLRRRDFLRLPGVGGLVLSIPILGRELSSRFKRGNQDGPFTTSLNAIGTVVQIMIDDPISRASANLAVSSVSDEITRLEKVLTRFPGGTDVCTLNQTGSVESPSSDLLSVLQNATSNSVASGDSFDVTVKPILDLLQGYRVGSPFHLIRNLIMRRTSSTTRTLTFQVRL